MSDENFSKFISNRKIRCQYCEKCTPQPVKNRRGHFYCSRSPYTQFSVFQGTFFDKRQFGRWSTAIEVFAKGQAVPIMGDRKTQAFYWRVIEQALFEHPAESENISGQTFRLQQLDYNTDIDVVVRPNGFVYLTVTENIFLFEAFPKWRNATLAGDNPKAGKKVRSVFAKFKKWLDESGRLPFDARPKQRRREELSATWRRYKKWLQFNLNQFAFFYNRKFKEQAIFRDLLIAVSKVKA